MMTATSLNRLDGHARPGVLRPTHEPRLLVCARESVRLAQENEVLRQSCADLTTAAETWIRLYESALSRANAAEQEIGRLAVKG